MTGEVVMDVLWGFSLSSLRVSVYLLLASLIGGVLLFGEHLFIFPSTKSFRVLFKNTGFDRLFLPQPFLTHLVSLL